MISASSYSRLSQGQEFSLSIRLCLAREEEREPRIEKERNPSLVGALNLLSLNP